VPYSQSTSIARELLARKPSGDGVLQHRVTQDSVAAVIVFTAAGNEDGLTPHGARPA